jgi:glutamate racemase
VLLPVPVAETLYSPYVVELRLAKASGRFAQWTPTIWTVSFSPTSPSQMSRSDPRPIGMFDSGFGGLTVARATIDLLPAEDLVYLGDTARYPYGSKPQEDVLDHALEIAEHLVDTYDVKMLVVACNTATAAALDQLRDESPVPVMGVIEPGVRATLEATELDRVAVIGTVGTVSSGAYEEAFGKIDASVEVFACSCPGFVEFVERGNTEGPQAQILAERLLAPVIEANIDTLLLGCTHYPYLARVIGAAMGPEVYLVSSADETAFALARELEVSGSKHPDAHRVGRHHFISSGDVRAFTVLGSRLLGPELVDAERWEPHET